MTEAMQWFEDRDWCYLRVKGKDRVDFFHRLTTNSIPKPGQPAAHTFFLSVSAKVLAEFWVVATAEHLSLFTPRAQLTSAKENIDRFHFSEDLQLEEPAGKLFVLTNLSPEVLEAFTVLAEIVQSPDPRHGETSAWFFVEEPQVEAFVSLCSESGVALSQTEADALRLVTGRPRYEVDYTGDTLFLEMAQDDDFSEAKGCYPGQEIVARILHRGRLQRHLRAFESQEMIPMDWTSVADGKEMARVTTILPWEEGGSRGFLYVRREVGESGQILQGKDSSGVTFSLTVRARPGEVLTGSSE